MIALIAWALVLIAIPLLSCLGYKEKIKIELLTVLITSVLAVAGYLFTSAENSKLASERLSQEKNLTLWKDQKDLSFEFIEFLDKEFFFNATMQRGNKTSNEYTIQTQKLLDGLNSYYSKLYLIADTSLIIRLNEILDGPVTRAQRYYLLSQIRLQMLKYIKDKDSIGPEDAPYKSLNPSNVPVLFDDKKFSNFEEMKKAYPYIEPGDESNTYKGLPAFSTDPIEQ